MDHKNSITDDSFHAKKKRDFSMKTIILKVSLIGIEPTARPGDKRQHVDLAPIATPL
jgi:hypothetical protein